MCIDDAIADQKLGIAAGEALRNRLNDIRAADSVEELVAGRPQAIRLGDQDCYRLELVTGTWLTVVPNHLRSRVGADGQPDWGKIRRVRVIAVGN